MQSSSSTESTEQIVTFALCGELYAVPILDVQEIIPISEVTPLPNAPAYVMGVITVRNNVVIVLDLAKRLALTEPSNGHYIVIIRKGEQLYGFTVDEVKSVLRVNREQAHPVEGVQSRSAELAKFMDCVLVVNGNIIVALNAQNILASDNLESVHNLGAAVAK